MMDTLLIVVQTNMHKGLKSLVEKEGINNCRNDWVLSRRRQKRLWQDSTPAVVVDKSFRTIPVASDNSSTSRGRSSSPAPADVSTDVRGKHDSAAASAASVECRQWLGASRHCDVSNVRLAYGCGGTPCAWRGCSALVVCS
jgi:hypothetical protein